MASDILDVLNISEETRVEGRELKRQHKENESSNKRLQRSKMNRELYNLIGPNLPPVAVHKQGIKFKEKLNADKTTHWVWSPFKDGARDDKNMEFHHWVKQTSASTGAPAGETSEAGVTEPYKFEKYNTTLNIPEFTEQYYKDNLSDLDASWDYGETKYLFDLAKTYDLRWAVIADNYEYEEVKDKAAKSEGRTLEDLKARLYEVSSKILENQPEGIKDTTLIRSLKAFDKSKEEERRRYLEHLLERSPTEIAEEESLVIEARKLELAAKKMLTERAELLQLLDSPQSSTSIQKYMTSAGLAQLYNSLMNVDKSKKRKPEAPVAPQLGPSALPHTQVTGRQQQQLLYAQQHSRNNNNNNKRKNRSASPGTPSGSEAYSGADGNPSDIQQLIQSRLTPEQMEVYGISIHQEKIQPGVLVRSQKIKSFRPGMQVKVQEVLNELGLSVRPTMATPKVSAKFDKLLRSIEELIKLKKQTDTIKAEIELVKKQKEEE